MTLSRLNNKNYQAIFNNTQSLIKFPLNKSRSNPSYLLAVRQPFFFNRSLVNFPYTTSIKPFFTEAFSYPPTLNLSKIILLVLFGGLSFYRGWIYFRDWYYDYNIEIGNSQVASQNFAKTKYHSQLKEKLRQEYYSSTNQITLVGAQGLGKTAEIAECYENTAEWFTRGRFSRSYRPWLKIWITVPYHYTLSQTEELLNQKFLELAKKIDQGFLPNIRQESFRSKIINLLPSIPYLPASIKSYFKFDFIKQDEETTLKNLKIYLADHPGWLMVLDNLQYFEAVEKLIPQKGGILIITTNNENLETNPKKRIKFEPLDKEDSLKILQTHLLSIPHEPELNINQLIETMGGLPLGLVQACGYMNATKINISSYLNLLAKNPIRLLNSDSELIKHPNLFQTIELTLDQLRKEEEKIIPRWKRYFCTIEFSGERFLHIMGLLAASEIPESLLRQAFCKKLSLEEELLFDNICKRLTQFNIIERHEDSFVLHSLIHQILHAKVKSKFLINPSWYSAENFKYYFSFLFQQISLIDAVLKAFKLLNEGYPQGEFLKLLPHFQTVEKLINNVSDRYYKQQHYIEFLTVTQKYLSILESNMSYLKSSTLLAKFFETNGNFREQLEKKIKLFEKVLKFQEKLFGADHEEVATTLNNLAMAYGLLGQASKERDLLERALPILEAYYGPDHVEVANTLNNLAVAYGSLGQVSKGCELLERALAIKEAHYGSDHVEVANTLNNLAVAYGSLGQVSKGCELLERALAIKEAHYGTDHVKITDTLNNLANAYESLGQMSKGRELLERALPILEAYYGSDHVKVANTLNNLAVAYGSLGQASKERELLERALTIEETHYGPGHVEIAKTLNNLAVAYGSLGQTSKRRELLERALPILEAHYGSDHVEVANTLNNLAVAYGSLGQTSKKRELLERALAIKEAHYGPDHVEVANTLNNLALAYGSLGQASKGRELLERALTIEEAHYGTDHVKITDTLNNLAVAYGSLGQASKERDLLERALPILEAYYGSDHVEVANTLNNLALAYGSLGQASKGRELLERALTIEEAHYGTDHVKITDTLNNLAVAYGSLGQASKERDLLERALAIKEAHYGKVHPEVGITLLDLALTYGKLGDVQKKVRFLNSALEIFRNDTAYGEQHSITQQIIHELSLTPSFKKIPFSFFSPSQKGDNEKRESTESPRSKLT